MEHIDKISITERFQHAIDAGKQRLQEKKEEEEENKRRSLILYQIKIQQLIEKYVGPFNTQLIKCAENVHSKEDDEDSIGYIKKSYTFYDLFEENDFINWDEFLHLSQLYDYDCVKIFLQEMKNIKLIPDQIIMNDIFVEKGSKEKYIRVTVSW